VNSARARWYQAEQLKALLTACRDGERVLFLFYLLTGNEKETSSSIARQQLVRSHLILNIRY